jgi:hypothetical protein
MENKRKNIEKRNDRQQKSNDREQKPNAKFDIELVRVNKPLKVSLTCMSIFN